MEKHEKAKTEAAKKGMDWELRELTRHCQRLSWRGSVCISEEITAIMKKQKNGSQSFWDMGEVITLVLHRPYPPYAKGALDMSKGSKDYFRRFEPDSIIPLLQESYHSDTTQLR